MGELYEAEVASAGVHVSVMSFYLLPENIILIFVMTADRPRVKKIRDHAVILLPYKANDPFLQRLCKYIPTHFRMCPKRDIRHVVDCSLKHS